MSGKTYIDYEGLNSSIKNLQVEMPNSSKEVGIINDALGLLDGISKEHDSFLSAEVSDTVVTSNLDTANTNYEQYISSLQGVIGTFSPLDRGPGGTPPGGDDGGGEGETPPNNNNPKLNIDTNGDGKADLNVDTNGDGKADLNIDTNGDGKADLNVDTNGDGKPDLNIDTDGDGKPDLNVDTNGDGKPDLNVDSDGDGKPDKNVDTNNDGTADKNIVNTEDVTHTGAGFGGEGSEFAGEGEIDSEIQKILDLDGTEDESILNGLSKLSGSILGGKNGFDIGFNSENGSGKGIGGIGAAAGIAGLGTAATAGILLAKKRKEQGIVGDEFDEDDLFDDEDDDDDFEDDIDEKDILGKFNDETSDEDDSSKTKKKKQWLYGLGIGLAGAGLAAGLATKDDEDDDDDF